MRVYVNAELAVTGDAPPLRYSLVDEAGQPVDADVGVGVGDQGFGPFIPAALAPIAVEPQAGTVDLEDPGQAALEEIDAAIDAGDYEKARALAAREDLRRRGGPILPPQPPPSPELEAYLAETWRAVDLATGSTAIADQVVGELRAVDWTKAVQP